MTKLYLVACDKVNNFARKFRSEEEGATMVEYGLLLALIAIVSIALITSIGTGLRDKVWTVINNAIAAA